MKHLRSCAWATLSIAVAAWAGRGLAQSAPEVPADPGVAAGDPVDAAEGGAEVAADLLPDLIVDPVPLSDTRIDTLTLPGHRLLRLATSTPNIGEGPLEIRGSTLLAPDRQEVVQRIYRADGSFWDRPAGTSVYHPTHAHTHFDDWAVYRLRALQADGSPGAVVAEGEKTSFCLIDIFPYDVEADAPVYTTCGQTVQGISPGWADVYDRELDGQWIDVTGLPDGPYWLEVEVDPEQRILELPGFEDNNVAQVLIELSAEPTLLPMPPPVQPSPASNRAPEIELLAPAAEVTWVEHSLEGVPVQWQSLDADGDDVSVSLFIDRDTVEDAGTLPLGGLQNIPGEVGYAVINTAAMDLGMWYVFAVASDGSARAGAWSPGKLVLYTKGDLDFDGHVDRADWVLLAQRRRATQGLPLAKVVEGWERLLDMDRDGLVEERDIDAFRSVALSNPALHDGEHSH